MKTNSNPFRFIIALLSLGTCATAQTPATLVSFNGGNGANPQAGLVASGCTLYGTTLRTVGGSQQGARRSEPHKRESARHDAQEIVSHMPANFTTAAMISSE